MFVCVCAGEVQGAKEIIAAASDEPRATSRYFAQALTGGGPLQAAGQCVTGMCLCVYVRVYACMCVCVCTGPSWSFRLVLPVFFHSLYNQSMCSISSPCLAT